MDFFTHLVIGIVLGRLFSKDSNKQKAIALGSILPDFDIFLAWIPSISPNFYILSHRGLFHSFLALLFMFPFIVLLLNKILMYNRLESIKEELNIQITTISYIYGIIGSYIHLFMDLLNPQGIAPLIPLSDQRYTLSTMNFIEPLVSIPAFVLIIILIFKKYYKKQSINIITFDKASRVISLTFVFFIILNTFLMTQTITAQKTTNTVPDWIFINRWVIIDENDTYTVILINQLTQQVEKSYSLTKISFNESELTIAQAHQLIEKAKDSIQYRKFQFNLDPDVRTMVNITRNIMSNQWVVSFIDIVGQVQSKYYGLPENSFFQNSVKIKINNS